MDREEKKRVGILSMQRVINYGSFLQAFALKKIIENLDCDVYFIDIVPGVQLKGLEYSHSYWSKFKTIFNAIIRGKIRKKLNEKRFVNNLENKFKKRYFNLLELDKKSKASYDVIVIGSDEVFNACQSVPWGFSKQLFGEGLRAAKIISYAASFGHTSLDDINKWNIKKDITNALKNISAISVRDDNSSTIITELIGKKPFHHVDPVLIYDYSDYMNTEILEKDYIVIYTYPNRIIKQKVEAIIAFAKEQKKKLISIGCAYDWCDKVIFPQTPFEVLSFFKYADYIITDTFHGTIYSIKFNKRFCSIIRESNTQKLSSLLKQFKLETQIVKEIGDIRKILLSCPNFTDANRTIEIEKENTQEYLNNQI